ncbi:hypothetical protein M2262_000965 [Pseudomonas sp. BIGb0408]|uniref:Uncharacterized protein n=1 Tax=Phytopseudomonas flavescens TaxID=29435 RepID=A0A7Y9XQW6_9GAMM|nr:hypothetical protein [Pseudomonas sp. BIGb0408]MCW2290915.1 hypothetical protein [Pseudomonas sp. BIGb0408]NYH74514.1 hypothetical protein [Pseudomonas flavescens]
MTYLYLIPEEVRNAKQISDELKAVANSASSNKAYVGWNFIILVLGGIAGLFGYQFIDDSLLNASIAFSGIIIGFTITSMLFSGRSQYLTKLTYEQTILYAHKTRYMLMSQINTLFAFLMCLLFCMLSMVSMKSGILEKSVVIAAASGFLTLGCYRILLLPFQIYEVHSFALDNLVAESKEDVTAETKAKTQERLKLLEGIKK